MPGREERMEFLTLGVRRRKSSKTETIGGQKAVCSRVGGRLAEIPQEANLGKRS